jgi:xanthine dehydrogenase accessory factor
MRDILAQAQAWQAEGDRIALATLVRAYGSSPRPTGARMIVSSAGRLAGSVSGGCVETAVYEEGLKVIESGLPRLLHFGITDEEILWEVGLSCGGEIEVWVERLEPGFRQTLQENIEQDATFALVMVIGGEEDARPTGLVFPDGSTSTTLDERIIPDALAALEQPAPVIHTYADPALEVFVEPVLPPPTLLIFGGMHAAIPLERFARQMGFRTIVADPRSKFANRERFPEAGQVINAWPDKVLSQVSTDRNTYVALLSHDPKIEDPALKSVLDTPAAYVGVIGSPRTHARRIERLSKEGLDAGRLQALHAPIGLDIGGQTAEEIALSIIAEIVAVRNGRLDRVRSNEKRGRL